MTTIDTATGREATIFTPPEGRLPLPAGTDKVWCVQTTKGLHTDEITDWTTHLVATATMSLFAGHVLRGHPGAVLTVENEHAWRIKYADGQTRFIDMIERAIL